MDLKKLSVRTIGDVDFSQRLRINSLRQISLNYCRMTENQGIDIIKTENLYSFDGRQAYSLRSRTIKIIKVAR